MASSKIAASSAQIDQKELHRILDAQPKSYTFSALVTFITRHYKIGRCLAQMYVMEWERASNKQTN